MADPTTKDDHVTDLLLRWQAGDGTAGSRAVGKVYDELRKIARAYLRKERASHTLQTTALVNEAYIRLAEQHQHPNWENRGHFFGVMAKLMRQALIEHARAKQAQKRGRSPGESPGTYDENVEQNASEGDSLLKLDDALKDLERVDALKSRVVELRCFVGLSVEETAEILERSPSSVKRDWACARAWLRRYMQQKEFS